MRKNYNLKRSMRIAMWSISLAFSLNGMAGEDSHDEHEESGHIPLTVLEEFGVEVMTASAGVIRTEQVFNGEIALIPQNVVHVAPPIKGIATKVLKSLGDNVNEGDVLATLTSRELATARAALLAAVSKQKLANATYRREKNLFEKKISAESDYLSAEQGLAAAKIEVASAKHRLLALGLGENGYTREDTHGSLTSYTLTAAASGIIIEKHITRGELVGPESRSFVIADLSSVWAELTVYQKDLNKIQEGLTVRVDIGGEHEPAESVIEYISPIIEVESRSTTARFVIDNKKGSWRPGMFIEATVSVGSKGFDVVVPNTAVQKLSGKSVIFVKDDDGFEAREVSLGDGDSMNVPVLRGVEAGDVIAAKNSFTLKAELQKGEFGEDHGH